MKSTAKIVLGVLMTVCAAGAIASASASAEACHKTAGSKEWTLCVEGEEIGSVTKKGVVALSTHIRPGTHATFGIEPISFSGPLAECSKATGSGSLDSGREGGSEDGSAEATNLNLVYERCKMEGEQAPPECKMPESVNFKPLLKGQVGPATSLKLNPGGGELTSYTLQGECYPLVGTRGLRGVPECTIEEAEAEKVEHEIKCEDGVGGKASRVDTLFGGAAQFTLEEMAELSEGYKGKRFSIVESD